MFPCIGTVVFGLLICFVHDGMNIYARKYFLSCINVSCDSEIRLNLLLVVLLLRRYAIFRYFEYCC